MKHISKISRREKQRDGITNMKKGDWVQSARKTDWQPFQGKKNNKKLGISQRVLVDRIASPNNKQKSERKFMTFKWQNDQSPELWRKL